MKIRSITKFASTSRSDGPVLEVADMDDDTPGFRIEGLKPGYFWCPTFVEWQAIKALIDGYFSRPNAVENSFEVSS